MFFSKKWIDKKCTFCSCFRCLWALRRHRLFQIHRTRLRFCDWGIDPELHRAKAAINFLGDLQLSWLDIDLLKLRHPLHLHLDVPAVRSADWKASKIVPRRMRVARGKALQEGVGHRQEDRSARQANGVAGLRGTSGHRISGNVQLRSNRSSASQSADHASHVLHKFGKRISRNNQYNKKWIFVFAVEQKVNH